MLHPLTKVFIWNDTRPEKTIVAASASLDSVEIYYALENRLSRYGDSCTVSSHVWSGESRRYLVEELAAQN